MADDLQLTETQRKVLEALCRPSAGGNHFAPPATNQEIADELFLSVDAIKAHLRVLFRKFGIEDLPHNQKRARLAELAAERGFTGPQPGPEAAEAPQRPAPRPDPEVLAKRQGRRPTPLLIAAGAAVGVIAVVGLVIALMSGGGGEQPAKADVVKAIRASCASGITAAGAQAGDAPDPQDTLTAINYVSLGVADAGAPDGDTGGLDKFTVGISKARAPLNAIAGGSATGAAAFADLTLAAGFIEAGSVEFGLGGPGSPCYEIGARVGATEPNPG